MTITNLSDLGGVVCVDGRENELIITAIADGIAKPGWGVTILGTAGAAVGEMLNYDVAATDCFVGLCLEKYNTDCDAVATDRHIWEIVIPASGHKYNVPIATIGAGEGNIGTPVYMGAVDGEFIVQTAALEVFQYCALVSRPVVNGDRYAEVVWRS